MSVQERQQQQLQQQQHQQGAQGPVTLDEFLARPPDHPWSELVDGWPLVSPGPIPLHQLVVLRLGQILDAARPDGHVVLPAPLDWVLWRERGGRVRQPDLMVVADSVLHEKRVTVPPLLCIEVLSPGSTETDLIRKPGEYGLAGARHTWVIDPQAAVVFVFEATPDRVDLVQQVAGSDELVVHHPFPVRFRPDDLLQH